MDKTVESQYLGSFFSTFKWDNEVGSLCLVYSRWWDAPPSLDMHDSESKFTLQEICMSSSCLDSLYPTIFRCHQDTKKCPNVLGWFDGVSQLFW